MPSSADAAVDRLGEADEWPPARRCAPNRDVMELAAECRAVAGGPANAVKRAHRQSRGGLRESRSWPDRRCRSRNRRAPGLPSSTNVTREPTTWASRSAWRRVRAVGAGARQVLGRCRFARAASALLVLCLRRRPGLDEQRPRHQQAQRGHAECGEKDLGAETHQRRATGYGLAAAGPAGLLAGHSLRAVA